MKKLFFILRDGEFLLTKTGRVKRFKSEENAEKYLSKGGVQKKDRKKFSIVSY